VFDVLASVLAFLFGYLAGSIPFGVIITAMGGAADPRTIGSGNIGATNVLRTGRKDLAALTLLADALKGTAAIVIASRFQMAQHPPVDLGLAAALGAFLGHCYPVFLKFRGGKGVATFLGCLIAVAWSAALAFAVVWLAAFAATRISSIGALAASVAAPAVLALTGRGDAALVFAALAVLLWIKHRANIERLLHGAESKFGKAG
jgi:acyl phosphate:glycerol-3-phosphate acyltransferase